MKKRSYSAFVMFVFFALLLGMTFPEDAHAGYIDSGAGSTLVQGIIAAAAGLGKMWHSFCRTLRLRK